MLVVIYPKILHHSFIPTIYENFKSLFRLILRKRKFGSFYTGLVYVIETIKVI